MELVDVDRGRLAARLTDDRYFLDIGQYIAGNGSLDGLPRERVVVDFFDDVYGRCFPTICERASLLNQPTVAFAGPLSLGKAAVGIENPRTNLLGGRIPTNHLHSRHVDSIANHGGK